MRAIFFLLSLSAVFALSVGQYTLSQAYISSRTQIVSQNYAWYQKIDASFFKLYNALRTKTDSIYRPFTSIYNDLNSAYEDLNVDSLSPEIAGNFTAFINNVNSSIWYNKEYASKISLSTFGMMMMGPDFLTPPASSFRDSLMGINSLMMRVNSPLVTDECLKLTLSQVVPTYKPYAEYIVNLAGNALQQVPAIFSNATSISSSAYIELKSLITKIKNCAKSKSKDFCVDQLNQQNSNCIEVNSCLAEKAVYKPQTEVQAAVMEIQNIYPLYSMIPTDLYTEMQDLTKICLDPETSPEGSGFQ